ncbi:MAG: YceI family protein [Caldilineaceae bacterium]
MKQAYSYGMLVLLVTLSLVLASCTSAAPAAAPAASAPAAGGAPEAAAEATAEAAAAPAAEAASGSNIEAPQVSPADQAPEATPIGDTGTGSQASSAGQRVFAIVPDQSQAQYAVEEEFFGQAIPFVTAVGKTSAIDGSVTLDFADGGVNIANSTFTVDLSTLKSDSGRRDRAIRERWLESAKYPLATFVATGVKNMPPDADFGKDVAFQVAGDMTIRDTTKPLTWDMTAKVDGETLTGSASTFLYMKDFGFDAPDIAGILKVTDGVTVTVQFTAQEVK